MNIQLPLKTVRWILDRVLPPTCPGCGVVQHDPHALCCECWAKLTFLGQPCCDACGHPFEYDVPDRTLCGPCYQSPPPFRRARAAFVYDAGSKDLVLKFKHADHTDMTLLFAKWLIRCGHELVQTADVIVPVPLHWTRLFARRYNQAAMLALAVAKPSNATVIVDALVRHKRTKSQGHLGFGARTKNVSGAFCVKPKHRLQLREKRVLLVDDVFTTGATVRALSRVLHSAGVQSVDVLTVARVVKK